jgi:hypothetical protein
MLDRIDREIDVELGPVEMPGMRERDIDELADRRLAEPREIGLGHEELALIDQEPEAVPRDVADLNARSMLATLLGSHPHAP